MNGSCCPRASVEGVTSLPWELVNREGSHWMIDHNSYKWWLSVLLWECYYYYYFHLTGIFQVNLGQLVPPQVLLLHLFQKRISGEGFSPVSVVASERTHPYLNQWPGLVLSISTTGLWENWPIWVKIPANIVITSGILILYIDVLPIKYY